MEVEFDFSKSQKNACERSLPFKLVTEFDWETAIIIQDQRYSYPEPRFLATGYIGERLYVVCFTPITDQKIRVISFRKANKREVRQYEKETINQ